MLASLIHVVTHEYLNFCILNSKQLFNLIFENFIEIYLIYNVLIFIVQDSDSITHTHIYYFPLWFLTEYCI